MNLLSKIFGRDHSKERIDRAIVERDEAALNLKESRELGSRIRSHDSRNHLTERMAAAFAANERRRHT